MTSLPRFMKRDRIHRRLRRERTSRVWTSACEDQCITLQEFRRKRDLPDSPADLPECRSVPSLIIRRYGVDFFQVRCFQQKDDRFRERLPGAGCFPTRDQSSRGGLEPGCIQKMYGQCRSSRFLLTGKGGHDSFRNCQWLKNGIRSQLIAEKFQCKTAQSGIRAVIIPLVYALLFFHQSRPQKRGAIDQFPFSTGDPVCQRTPGFVGKNRFRICRRSAGAPYCRERLFEAQFPPFIFK